MGEGGGGVGIDICTTASQCFGGAQGGEGGGFHSPGGAATDGAGNVYAVDSGNHRIQKFDSAGNFLAAWGKDVVAVGGTGFEVCIAAASCQAGQPSGRRAPPTRGVSRGAPQLKGEGR
jgi:DNA-binding beta-propeller fold protein YncE